MKQRFLYIFLLMLFAKVGMGQSFTLANGYYDVNATPVNYNCGRVIFNFNTGNSSTSDVDFEVFFIDQSNTLFSLGSEAYTKNYISSKTYPVPFFLGVVKFYAVFKDHDSGNTLFTSVTYTVEIRSTPTVSATTPLARCDAGTVTLGATPSAGSINWYSGLTGGSSLQTGSSYTTPSINTTTTYYVDATNNGCTTVTRTAVVATVNTTPTVSATTPLARCDAGTVTLGATPSAGSINWYSGLTGGSSLQTGSSYTTPSINTTTTYYVDATNNGCTTVTRTAVVATVNTTPLTPVANSISLKYNGLQQSIPDLILPTGQSISWFNASTGGVSSTKPQGKNVASYNSYASAIIDATGCVSLTRTFIELTITKAPLIITGIAGANKIYDGTTNVTINGTASYVGLVASDAGLAVTGTPSFNFNNKNVGNSKPITVTGFTAPSPNYTLTQPADLVGSITPKTASINIVANNKEYDGTTTATLNNISSPSFIAGDIVNINYTAAVFDTKDPGTNKTVTVTGINLGGVDAFNYNLTNTTATAIANITGAITSSIRPFVLPNAFTPNGDTKNTEFKFIVNDPSKITLRLFQIYNRNGKLMFSTNDISKGWDGRYNGVIQDMGVYFVKYRIDINGASPSVDTVPFYLLK